MRLVVTGANGGLGMAFLSHVPAHHDVVALTHADLDVSDHHGVMQTIVPLAPDAVLSFAAMTAVDECEADPEAAYRANTIGPQNLALAARRSGAMLLHVSTDYVFDGEKGSPYDELDAVHPINTYARSKLGGETAIRTLHPEHFIVRTSYVFGGGTEYASTAVDRLSSGDAAGGLSDRVGSPTYVRHLAERILPLVLTGRFGTYHVCGADPGSWYDVLAHAKAIAGLPGELRPQTSDELGLPARRPANSSMVSLFAKDLGLEPTPPLEVAVKEWLDGRGH
jgi:dTDP-4-dehydrorhamnose reductase